MSPPASNLYNTSPGLKVGWGIDSPIGFVVMDGEAWVIFNSGNQYGTTVRVARYKGTDFEHAERQGDGVIIVEKGVSTHFCGGLWYDSTAGKLYAPIHCEYERDITPPAGWSRKKTRLATSTDKGLTWRLEGDILTDCMPGEGDWLRFSGSYFEAGPADFDFYVDDRGGYFYIYSCNSYAPKRGKMNNFLWFNEVARCAIADRMAPGKWKKFCRGAWTEPGLGGRSSKVSMGSYGIYGRIIYSRFLRKYLRIGVTLGVIDRRFTDTGFSDGSIYLSACDDLASQEWSAPGKLLDRPENDKFGITLTDGSSKDPFACDRALHVYNYWLYNIPSRAIDVDFAPGTTPAGEFPPFGSYAYEPLPESCDPVVSRMTRIVGCGSPENSYGVRGWTIRENPAYFQGRAMECGEPGGYVQFSFKGSGIYWRAIADTDGGKADVYIDEKLAGTVDCYYRTALPFQFAFLKTGLDPGAPHVFKAVLRSDRNPGSYGTVIRHMAFEYPAESYRASAGFSAVTGMNNWHYRRWEGKGYEDLQFFDFSRRTAPGAQNARSAQDRSFANYWGDEDNCRVGNDYLIPGGHRAVRTWVSPHRGRIRIEGTVQMAPGSKADLKATITHNTREAWTSKQGAPAGTPVHDITIDVEKGDMIDFIAEKTQGDEGEKMTWDPVITYER
ncbi:MAG TPA: hypothetical protein VK569_04165 [Bacteroidota bacterium]|nr:hypothetical protein [Bacteroidota bacterium]